jgi:uncharacterized protein YcaQ
MMTRFMSAETLLALAFIRSGIHTLTLESIRRYGYRLLPMLEKRTGCGWVLQWSNRYLEEVQANFVQVDEDVAELTTDTEGMGVVLDMIPGEVLEAAEQVEWEE